MKNVSGIVAARGKVATRSETILKRFWEQLEKSLDCRDNRKSNIIIFYYNSLHYEFAVLHHEKDFAYGLLIN